MKVIINRGTDKLLSRILVYKNDNKYETHTTDILTLDAKEGDNILIKSKSLDFLSATIATFVCESKDDILYIYPTILSKIWNAVNYIILPYSCLFLESLRLVITSETFKWFCVFMIALTALSVVCQKLSMHILFLRKRMYVLSRI